MKLHKLAKLFTDQTEGKWFVAITDTVDYRTGHKVVKQNFILERNPEAVIRQGEIVFSKKGLEEDTNNLHPFDNHFYMNYKGEDFRELTPEEIEEYVK